MQVSPYLERNWNLLTEGLPDIKEAFFTELVANYSDVTRHYHTLVHVEALLKYIDVYEDLISDPEASRWAAWYHDAIYDAARQDNEEKSVELAVNRMSELGCSDELKERTSQLIIATKTHETEKGDSDLSFFLDIDLSILASDWEIYSEYTKQIRQEYQMYPDEVYNAGRGKVLEHFLRAEEIFKTDVFRAKWEDKARSNLKRELEVLA